MTPVTSLGPLVEIEKELRGYLSGGDDSWLHPYKEGRSAYLSVWLLELLTNCIRGQFTRPLIESRAKGVPTP